MGTLQGKIVVITGSTRGFGYATAQAALQAGAIVVVSGRSQPALEQAVANLRSLGKVEGILCDVSEERQVYALARRAADRFGRIDVWVNNAGYSASAGMLMDLPPQQAVDMFLVNDMGTLYGAHAALHFMLPLRQGTLVNVYGAGSFLRPSSPTGLYAATKAWISSITRTLAQELRGSGVKLLGFSPGMLLTEMLTAPTVHGEAARGPMKNYAFVLRMLAGSPEKAARRLISTVATQRKEFAEVRLFKPWTPLAGLLRIAWENVTGTARPPEFELHYEP
ncbi:MAG TPA: SDR family oxidoreductase, partial [Ramlibacter sp.]|nr:SDR family oxidoreductase [Ramlibacter sp.]